MRRLAQIPGITFILFIGWKVSMLLITAQPVPANDSFFYDGPVVNYLLHGKYCNPSLAGALPISGGVVFSAYPPLHQFALLAWMKCAGTSAWSAMGYHILWLAVFALAVFATLRRLGASPVAINWAGLFLFAITFHDRPDTLAQALGALAVLALVTGWWRGPRWNWVAAGFLLLAFGTSLQIGGIYLLLLSLLMLGRAALEKERIPWRPILAFLGTLLGLVAVVRFGFPLWWAGFQEHVRLTPSLTGWRLPAPDELLKVGRATAGILLVAGLMASLRVTGRLRRAYLRDTPLALVAVAGVLTSFALIAGCLFILTPNTILIATYLQPLVVGSGLAALTRFEWVPSVRRWFAPGLAFAVALVSIRALGMSTWGARCARDFSYEAGMKLIREQAATLHGDQPVAASSAYLYELARVSPVDWLHADWLVRVGEGRADLTLESLVLARPQKVILTQFDYHRRYHSILVDLEHHPAVLKVGVRDYARVAPPDASPTWQKVVQHVSWAPVIADITWQPASRD
jgi:hypothetical protein